ncbi:MAG: sigma-70 family RNA polymerase sigma factor [Propionicimonas sp.]|uniref:RNA polymerase sigma factor n=1 Tax=Propionicimonas sp. TaxID=1955623 RepID=UPI003D0C1BAC
MNTTAPLGAQAASAFVAYREGDRDQLRVLVGLLTPLLWHTARAQRAPQHIAEEAIQTAWLRLVDGAATIADPRGVVSWLVVTVKRETWRLLRLAGREVAPEAGVPDVADEVTPESLSIATEQQRVLWRHVEDLPERCRALLRVIAFAATPDYAGVAASLGMPIGSIGPTRGRCLAKLRTALLSDPSWEA